jgi:hypothetical protein
MRGCTLASRAIFTPTWCRRVGSCASAAAAWRYAIRQGSKAGDQAAQRRSRRAHGLLADLLAELEERVADVPDRYRWDYIEALVICRKLSLAPPETRVSGGRAALTQRRALGQFHLSRGSRPSTVRWSYARQARPGTPVDCAAVAGARCPPPAGTGREPGGGWDAKTDLELARTPRRPGTHEPRDRRARSADRRQSPLDGRTAPEAPRSNGLCAH